MPSCSDRHTVRGAVLAAAVLLGFGPGAGIPGATAETGGAAFDRDRAMERSQAAIGNQLGDHELVDVDGERVRLHELQGDKPLVVHLIFTSCVHACSMQTARLDDVVATARDALGEDSFRVVTVGFDTRTDGPGEMRHLARQHRVNDDRWYFLSAKGDQETIDALADDLGFSYRPSPRGFDHTVKASVIAASGEVYRHVYGESFPTPQFVQPLKQLTLGTPRPDQGVMERLADRVRLFCTTYDPKGDRYYFDYSMFAGMAIGGVIISGTFVFLLREGLRRRRRG